MALIRPPVDQPGHRMLILDAEAWVACLPRDHRLASRDEVEIAELLDDPIVCAPMSAGMWRDYWLAMDARGGREPTIAAVAATYEAETTCIARGLGISFTTQVERLTEDSVVLGRRHRATGGSRRLRHRLRVDEGWAADLIGLDVADKVGKVWGLGSDTTKDTRPVGGRAMQHNMWKPTQQENLWFHGGDLHQSRHYSLYLALQLKARHKGIPIPVYGPQEVHHVS